MKCYPFRVLAITDGTTRVNLLQKKSGFCCVDWTPSITEPKGGGVWRDSPMADGRTLAMKKQQNATETYTLQVHNWSSDDLIKDTQDLRRLLEKATAYRMSQWQSEPVWIEAQGVYEENLRYSIIEDYRTPSDGYPYGGSFWNALGRAAFADWPLVLEREPYWRSVPPGQPCPDDRSESITWTESGCDPSYLIFDGANSVVDCLSNWSIDDLPSGGEITIEMYARPISYGEGNLGYFIRKGAGWAIWFEAGNLNFRVYAGLGNSTAQVAYTIDSAWHHFAFTYDDVGARQAQIWLDGTLVATGGAANGAYTADAASSLFIGASNAAAANSFDGDIGWVRVSNVVRYTGAFTPPGRCTPPVPSSGTRLLLRHSPGYGATTDDYSGYNNDGALTAILWGCDCFYTTTIYPCWPNYLEFNGETSLVTVADAASIRNLPGLAAHNDQITVEAWIRARSYGEGGDWGRIAVKGSNDTNTRGWHFLVDSTFGLLGYVDCDNQDAISGTNLGEFSVDSLWHHVLMCYDEAGASTPAARTVYLAVDGVWTAVAPTQLSVGPYSSDNGDDLIIGNNAIGARTFDGDIGWVRVHNDIPYNPAVGNFTPEPRCELPPIDSGVVLQVIYEGTGATTYDRSGNDNDGAITEAVWDCDCDYTDEDDVECNCVQADGEQEWGYTNWAVDDNQPTGVVSHIIELLSGRLLACETNSEVWRTDDGGATAWLASTTPPAGALTCRAMVEVAADDVFLLGYDVGPRVECWRSTDGGVNWGPGPQNGDVGGGIQAIGTCCLAYFKGYLYAACGTLGLFRSNDNGVTWVQVSSRVVERVCSWGDYLFTNERVSPGDTIQRSSDGTTFSTVLSIAGDSVDFIRPLSDGYIYAGTDETLYRSTDGVHWGIAWVSPNAASQLQDIVVDSRGLYYLVERTGDRLHRGTGTMFHEILGAGGGLNEPRTLCVHSTYGTTYMGETADIWRSPDEVTVGRYDTCLDEVMVANKANVAQITQAFVYDASTGIYIDQFPAGVFPYFIFPSPAGVGDCFLFCIETAILDSGPYCSIVFDLLQVMGATAWTIIWEYSTGAPGVWNTLNVSDGTQAFQVLGVNTVTWVPPDAWLPQAENGFTGLWIQARISAITNWVQSPIQQHRDIYTVTWPDVDIDELQVQGDVPALLRIRAHNRSDEDGYTDCIDELDLLDNRLIVGLRSDDRGIQFTSFINLAEDGIVANTYSQNPIGIVVTDGTGTTTAAEIRAPSGIACVHTTTGNGLTNYDDAAVVTLGPSIARDYYGTFHVFMRAQLEQPAESAAGTYDSVRVRLKLQTGSGGVYETIPIAPKTFTKFVGFDANGEHYKDFQLLDFGRATLPVSGAFDQDELPDQFTITVQIASAAATNLLVTLYDINLTPVDEWANDFVDTAFENDSGVTNGYLLDADSVTYPKRSLRATVRTADDSAFIRSVYERVGLGPAILQANADQRLFFLSAVGVLKGYEMVGGTATTLTDTYADFEDAGVVPGMIAYNVTTTNSAVITAVTPTACTTEAIAGNWNLNDLYFIVCPNWRADPCVVHSVQLEHVARYLSMRGAR